MSVNIETIPNNEQPIVMDDDTYNKMSEWAGTSDPDKRRWLDRAAAQLALTHATALTHIQVLEDKLAKLGEKAKEKENDQPRGGKHSKSRRDESSRTRSRTKRGRSKTTERTPRRSSLGS
ncbi:hypothetical protein M5689_020678 [Euphorbia peplus]|nr:hypothetical protein M5689_020678 [Euphorbia peplus]